MTDLDDLRIQMARTVLQHAYELVKGVRYTEDLEAAILETYEDAERVQALLKAEART